MVSSGIVDMCTHIGDPEEEEPSLMRSPKISSLDNMWFYGYKPAIEGGISIT